MLFYVYCAPAMHTPIQHSAQTTMVAADSHSHERGDHLHDDLDFVGDTSTAPDDHHALKAELVAAGRLQHRCPSIRSFPGDH
ncbi:hypothetical protein GOC22_11460 [Sinorhizobium meliloti]|uniref:hypothetical protein n=1 Tax=Rhizobium meliloti TaxID=382 RepID=UPI00299D7139|nr:hypothetical protein [Sinorhizobium meliloti]MDX0176453.1 hypothetical protein [Sinorhizobium meliloti]